MAKPPRTRICWRVMNVHRFSRRLRHATSLVLSVMLALSPMLSTAAQTHEAAHAAQGDEHFHAHDAGAAHEAPAHPTDDMPDAGAVLHVLAHAAHACGHTVAIVGSLPPAPRFDGAPLLLAALATTPGDAPRAHPFRPPID